MNLTPKNTFFVSDCHWQHRNIIKYSNRPFTSVEDMDEQMVRKWNDTVKPDDNVFSLGDFAFGKIGYIKNILSRLNGNIVMVLGNHDQEIIDNSESLINEGYVKEITPYKEIRIDGQFICLYHYGCRTWNRSHRGSFLLYGHSHGSLPPFGKSVDVGVDAPFVLGVPSYRPLSFYEIKDYMSKRKIETADYHGNHDE